ncbi:MAG: hypothetical protein NTW25_07380, partial [Candidatus Kapabacteria bacterium]|nr:hypothetical protein [Candidatus Kapabacteria bacterium]
MKSDIKIFQVNIVNNKSENTKIHGRVLWVDDFENFPDDEDLLEFMWDVPTNNQFVKSATELLEYLIKK